MTYCVDETIVAIASAPGGAMRGVVRISGPAMLRCVASCFTARDGVRLETVKCPTCVPGLLWTDSRLGGIPGDLYVWPSRRSYTRQPSAELHTLGSPPLLDAVVRALCRHGARLAHPGEFTLRAFLAGRVDLMQAEAVLGVVDADDTRALQVALAQLAGGMSDPLNQLRSQLLDLLADLEAGLDFVDEDIEFIERDELGRRIARAEETIAALLMRMAHRGESGRDVRIVLAGWPNVGKSSLLNALASADAAIVSPQAGTTRDYVTRRFDWSGARGVLIDTPGFESADASRPLAAAAQQLAGEQTRQADLVLLCLDASRPLNPWEQAALRDGSLPRRLVVGTKVDLTSEPQVDPAAQMIRTSSRTGEGIEPLRQLIVQTLASVCRPPEAVVAPTALRCRRSLELAAASLENAHRLVENHEGDELTAMELREALDQLGQVVGAVYTDEILDRIFGRFCIGK